MNKKMWMVFLMLTCCMLWGCSLSDTKEEQPKTEKADYIIGVEGENVPYYSVDENGNASGLYVDLMEQLAEKGGYSIAFTEIDAPAFQAMTGEESCDVFLGILEKETGDMTQLFQTSSFYQSNLILATRTEDGVKQCEELRNAAIDGRASAGEADFAQYLAVKYEADAVLFADGKTAGDDFLSGNAKALVLDENTFQTQFAENAALTVLKTSEKYHNAHRFTASSQSEFLKELETELTQLQSDGTLDHLLEQYGLK